MDYVFKAVVDRHKDNHKNSMAGTNVVHNVKRGDKVIIGQCWVNTKILTTSGDTLRLHRDLAGRFPR